MYLGAVSAVLGVCVVLLAAGIAAAWPDAVVPPPWLWPVVVVGPPVAGMAAAPVVAWRTGTRICPGGIRTRSVFADGMAPWDQVEDLRAERRGGRTVVSVYLRSGAYVRLQAPYSGGLFAADPHFERKVFALSHLWRSHRFGGLPG